MTARTVRTALALALPLIFALTPSARAQHQRILTDKSSPAVVVAQPGTTRLHVLTAGVDAKFDRILDLDSGDVAPRWFVIDTDTRAIVDSATFDAFFNSYPLRVGFDMAGARLYAAQAGRIRSYNINTLELADDTVALGDYSGISLDRQSGLMFAHMRPGFASVGYLVALDPATGDSAGVYLTGINPQMSVTEYDPANRGIAVYTLSEGSFGAADALVSYAGGNPDIYAAVHGRSVGEGVSDMITYLRGGSVPAAIAARASNVVRIIDTRSHRETSSIQVTAPTAVGADPTRSHVLIGTAGGWLYRYDEAAMRMLDGFALPGAAGAIATRDGLAAVAITHTDSTTTAPATSIVFVNTATGVVLDTVDVGRQPRRIFFDNSGDLHVIVADSNRMSPWIRLDGTTFAQASVRNVRDMHPRGGATYDGLTDSVYFVARDTVSRRYVIARAAAGNPDAWQTFYDDSTAAGELVDVTMASGGHLLAIERSLVSGGNGYVHALRIVDGVRVVKALAGSQPIKVASIAMSSRGAFGLYALSASTGAASLTHVAFKQNLLGVDTLGRGANHILASATGGPLAVTMNGNHELVVIDQLNAAVISRITTGTSGFDGPREAIELTGSLGSNYVVTTYAGDVRFLDPNGPYRIEPTGGKAEGIAAVGDVFYVANAFTPDYGPDSSVVIIGLASAVASEGASREALSQNTPNPASARTRVRIFVETSSHVRLEVRTLDGTLVAMPVDREMSAGEYDIDMPVATLASGTYMYTLRTGSTVASRLMRVVR